MVEVKISRRHGSDCSLSQYKLRHTVLYMSVAGRSAEEHMKLSELSALEKFFAAVLDISNAVLGGVAYAWVLMWELVDVCPHVRAGVGGGRGFEVQAWVDVGGGYWCW